MLLFLTVIEDAETRHCLEVLYQNYHKELWYIANDILKDEYEAQDVVQTAFIKVAGYIDKNFDPNCNKSRGLIVIIVRNLAINEYRKRKRGQATPFDEVVHNIENDTFESPEVRVLRLDNQHYIAEKLAQLRPAYADVLTLKYSLQYTDQEIAELLGVSHGNVRTRLTRARKALESLIGGETVEAAECE